MSNQPLYSRKYGVLTLCSSSLNSSLSYFSDNSTLRSLPGSSVQSGVATFDSIGIRTLAADLDVNGFTVRNLRASGGRLEGLKTVSTDELIITDSALYGAHSRALVALIGSKGQLETFPGLALDPNRTLLVASIGSHAWAGAVDANSHELRGATILGGSVSHVSEVQSDGGLSCKGDLDVGSDASIAGSLVVGGTVMGSGPYVDSSDVRFKTNIIDLFPLTGDKALGVESDTLKLVRALRPVRYRFNISGFPNRRFPEGDELGFIAQEVKEVLPELVSTSPDGFM